LQLDGKYLQFDLETTRRERDQLLRELARLRAMRRNRSSPNDRESAAASGSGGADLLNGNRRDRLPKGGRLPRLAPLTRHTEVPHCCYPCSDRIDGPATG